MEKSEKNFLEKFADAIPGLSGYRAREDRRTTDKRLREHLAARIDRVREALDAQKLLLTNQGNLAALNDVGLIGRKLQGIGDSLRFATYGYSGFFDQLKIKEGQLDQIYAHDLKLAEAVDALEKVIGDPAHAPEQAAACVKAIEDLLAQRKSLFEAP